MKIEEKVCYLSIKNSQYGGKSKPEHSEIIPISQPLWERGDSGVPD